MSAWQVAGSKPARDSLNVWMSANGYQQAIVDRVAAGTCDKKLLLQLKAQKQMANGPSGSLSQAQRLAFHGPTSASAASKGRGHGGEPSARTNDKGKGKGANGEGKGKGGGKRVWLKDTRTADQQQRTSRNDATAAEPNRKQLAAKVATLERKLAAAMSLPSAPSPARSEGSKPAEEPGSTPGWECTNCLARHDKSKRNACRLCLFPRPTNTAATPHAAKLTAEDVAKIRAALTAAKEAISVEGVMEPASRAAAVKGIDAKLKELQQREEQTGATKCAETVKLSPVDQVFAANGKVTEANAYVAKMLEKCRAAEARMAAMQADLTSIQLAVKLAKQEAQKAQEALTAASLTLLAGNPSADAMPSATAASDSSEAARFQQELAGALNTLFVQNQDTQRHYHLHINDSKKEGRTPLNLADWIVYAMGKQAAGRTTSAPVAAPAAQAPQHAEANAVPMEIPPAAQPPQHSEEAAAQGAQGASAAAARSQQDGDSGTRLSSKQQQQHPKAATLEASESNRARLTEQAARSTKEERERVLEASRKDDDLGNFTGAEQPVEPVGESLD